MTVASVLVLSSKNVLSSGWDNATTRLERTLYFARLADVKARPVDAATHATDGGRATRERIVQATARLLQQRGYGGMGVKQIAQEADAALGSIYHFFPGGKQELAAAAICHNDRVFTDSLRSALASDDDAVEAIVACTRSIAESLRESAWSDACGFTTAALEAAEQSSEILGAIQDALARWRGLISDKLHAGGIAEDDARDLAHTVINTLEGARLACLVERSDEPLRLAGQHLARLLDAYRDGR